MSRRSDTRRPLAARSLRTSWTMVWVMFAFYVFSFVDRTIITVMVGPIEHDLGITDFQMSLMIGPAFGIFYVLFGLALGILVDRLPRRLVTAGGVLIWGAATAACGMASSFLGLLAGRMGVGVGEATLTPAAHSMIGDSFPRNRLSIAISVFSTGSVIGAGVALIIGGAIVHAVTNYQAISLPLIGAIRSWQAVFLLAGLATMAMTPLLLLFPDPPRHQRSEHDAREASGFFALLRREPGIFVAMPAGFGFAGVLVYAYNAWLPTFLIRTHGLNTAQAGLTMGLLTVLAGFPGQLLSARLTDRSYACGKGDAHVKFHLWSLVIAIPLMIVALTTRSAWAFAVLAYPFYALIWTFVGYGSAALQLYAPPHMRGRISAMFLAVISTMGLALGPPAVGFLTTNIFRDPAKIGYSLAVVSLAVLPFLTLILLVAARAMRRMYAIHAGEASIRESAVPPLG